MLRDEPFGDTATGVNSVFTMIREMLGERLAQKMISKIKSSKDPLVNCFKIIGPEHRLVLLNSNV